jgi:hypothetical protein
MARTKARGKPEKVKKPLASETARHAVLACIKKPYRNAVGKSSHYHTDFLMIVKKKEQKKFFTDFLNRLEAREVELKKTDLAVSKSF